MMKNLDDIRENLNKQLEQGDERFKKAEAPAGLSTEVLLQMLIKTQTDLAKAQEKLGDALLESRKPYVDPKVLEQKKRDLEERRKMIATEQKNREMTKKICPHKRENGTWNIRWMQHSNNVVLGVCGQCFSQFDARQPEDLAILRQDLKSIKNMGRAGSHAQKGVLVSA
jgi:hypothetical protein